MTGGRRCAGGRVLAVATRARGISYAPRVADRINVKEAHGGAVAYDFIKKRFTDAKDDFDATGFGVEGNRSMEVMNWWHEFGDGEKQITLHYEGTIGSCNSDELPCKLCVRVKQSDTHYYYGLYPMHNWYEYWILPVAVESKYNKNWIDCKMFVHTEKTNEENGYNELMQQSIRLQFPAELNEDMQTLWSDVIFLGNKLSNVVEFSGEKWEGYETPGKGNAKMVGKNEALVDIEAHEAILILKLKYKDQVVTGLVYPPNMGVGDIVVKSNN